jgi:aerobic-type carbon monoxide dehydrogenase small subunit (CoxS/CutS family)
MGSVMEYSLRLTVNGAEHSLSVPGGETLATTLRDRLSLTGTKVACDRGECGSCTILRDALPLLACMTLTVCCDGAMLTTVEGLAQNGDLHPLQTAFLRCDALQCGFCTPGFLMMAATLLAETPRPDAEAIADGLEGNICRCGAYHGIVDAIQQAAAELERAHAGN